MKLSEVLAKLIKSNFTLDGSTDYERVSQAMKAEGLKPNKVQVWKLINALGDQGIEAEDDL